MAHPLSSFLIGPGSSILFALCVVLLEIGISCLMIASLTFVPWISGRLFCGSEFRFKGPLDGSTAVTAQIEVNALLKLKCSFHLVTFSIRALNETGK